MALDPLPKVKICGVNSAAAFDAVVAAGADYLGFVFFHASPRFVTAGEAAVLSARHEGGPKRVGLFVKPAMAEIEAVLAEVRLDVLQVYVPADEVAAIKARFGLPVWRAVGVAAAADFPAAGEAVDGYVLESKPPKGATRPGGNAVRADWELLAGWRGEKFWLLGGGLTADNVAGAIKLSGAPGVDVSSGVETSPGVKSPELIAKFVAAARRRGGRA
jgi:phosphoribosylanthranilate isomerase